MTNQASIKYISSLFDHPEQISDGDHDSIALFRQTYPYFIPARYILAAEKQRKERFAPAMLSEIHPYMGNWLMLCSFLDAGTRSNVQPQKTETPVTADVKHLPATEIKTETIKPVEQQVIVAETKAEAVKAIVEEIKPSVPSVVEEAGTGPDIEPVSIEEIKSVFPVMADDVKPVPELEIVKPIVEETRPAVITSAKEEDNELISPVYAEDYFLHQGVKISEVIPEDIEELKDMAKQKEDEDKSLMVVMSFSEWLLHFKNTTEKQKEEKDDQKALKTMWQKEKLAAAMEEENEEIPENVFEMAVNSIAKEDGLASESLADIYIKQGKYDKAVEMYRKLSLRNPKKNAYFARRIEEVLKEKQS